MLFFVSLRRQRVPQGKGVRAVCEGWGWVPRTGEITQDQAIPWGQHFLAVSGG